MKYDIKNCGYFDWVHFLRVGEGEDGHGREQWKRKNREKSPVFSRRDRRKEKG